MINMDLITQKKADISRLVIQHPDSERAMTQLRGAYIYNVQTGIPQNELLLGSTGTGKSTIKRVLVKEFGPEVREDRTIIPILTVDVPANPTIKNVAETILIKLGDPKFEKGSEASKTKRITHLVQKLGVKMIIFDEMQHFIDQGNRRTPIQVSDWLKTIINDAKVSTVLMGLNRTEILLEVNEQLRRRFSNQIVLKPFGFRTSQELVNFVGVLKRIDRSLGLPWPLSFDDMNLIKSMHFATNGIMDYMVKLMLGAYRIAQEEGFTEINHTCLERSFTEYIWVDGVGKANPFNKLFNGRRLVKPGQPFYDSNLLTSKKDERVSL